jgi:hypothetical protein
MARMPSRLWARQSSFGGRTKSKNTVYVWTPSDEPKSVGTINEYIQRGLRNARFMSIQEDGFIVWRYEPD